MARKIKYEITTNRNRKGEMQWVGKVSGRIVCREKFEEHAVAFMKGYSGVDFPVSKTHFVRFYSEPRKSEF